MGNANSWASAAQAAGFTVNNTPEEGAIMQSSEGALDMLLSLKVSIMMVLLLYQK